MTGVRATALLLSEQRGSSNQPVDERYAQMVASAPPGSSR